MGKAEVGTPKHLANKMKAKGLQRLRWYCQMCQKQCRDDNGFKCHISSESHQRQMILFAENPSMYMGGFSHEFETEFVKLLKRRFGTRRIKANTVYQEYISDRNHLHMNSTKWQTLTEFCKYLGRAGICEVEETEKGWYISYIDRDPEVIARQEALARRERNELDEEERLRRDLNEQIERAHEAAPVTETVYTELQKTEDEKIEFNLKRKLEEENIQPKKIKNVFDGEDEDEDVEKVNEKVNEKEMKNNNTKSKGMNQKEQEEPIPKKQKSSLEEIMEQEERKKEKSNRKDYWLRKGIVVKVLNKKLGDGAYYKKKGVVKEVHNKYVGEIEMFDSGDTIKVDQTHCETVIPNAGGKVLIVNGGYRGEMAELVSLDIKNYCATLKIIHGPYNERVVDSVPYEDFSKCE